MEYPKHTDSGQNRQGFEQFVKERRYLHNVSERTVQWYEEAFAWLSKFPLTADGAKDCVVAMRQAGLKPTSCNSRIRVFNAYFKWAELNFKVARLKEEHEVLPTFTKDQVRRIRDFKPTGWYGQRLHTLILTLFDTGLRIDEALGLTRDCVDFDQLLFVVKGKGNKQRQIPFSHELRKSLWRFMQKRDVGLLVFPTAQGNKLGRRVVLRDFKAMCRKIGFEPPRRTLHATRHSFALNYVRSGGDVFRLQRVLGHSTLEQTRKYVNLQTEDLSAVHNGLSLLTTSR
jgi:integrase/recombinase XerD